MPLAVDQGACLNAPGGGADDLVASLLAVDKGTFRDDPVCLANDPMAFPLAVVEPPGPPSGFPPKPST